MTAAIRVDRYKKVVKTDFWKPQTTLVDGITFSVPYGVIAGFVGHNGAGKSTTIKALIGAITPTEGSIEVLGGAPRSREVRRRLGYLPELPRLPETLTPREVLEAHAVLAGTGADKRPRTERLLAEVDLTQAADRRLGLLSKGMQQRLALAVALVGDPELLILDEPMSGLDPSGRKLVRDVLLEKRKQGKTVFLSSHVLPDVEALCDLVTVVHRGRTVASGPISEVLSARKTGFEIVFDAAGHDIGQGPFVGHGHPVARGDLWALEVGAGADVVAIASSLQAAGAKVVSLETRRAHLEDELLRLVEADRPGGPLGGPQ